MVYIIITYIETHLPLSFTHEAKYFYFPSGLAFQYLKNHIFCKCKLFTVCCFILVTYEILFPYEPEGLYFMHQRNHWFSPYCHHFKIQSSAYDTTISKFLVCFSYFLLVWSIQFYSHLLSTQQMLITEVTIKDKKMYRNNKIKI